MMERDGNASDHLPRQAVGIPQDELVAGPSGQPESIHPRALLAQVSDRFIQQAIAQVISAQWEPHFHRHSYGFRPERSAHQAVREVQGTIRAGYGWVVDMDLQAFFDRVNHDRLMARLKSRCLDTGLLRLVNRFLKAGVSVGGHIEPTTMGVPQGGVISPLLANLFLHYVFDKWMQREHADVPFERYADDAVCHCHSQSQAQALMGDLGRRFAQCGLELHPLKTRVVYCKDADRRGSYADTSFDFLGFTFRPRLSKNRWGKTFVNFSPAISAKAGKAIRQEIRSWNLQNRSDKSLTDLAHMFNAKIRGWVNYYGAFYKSALYPTLRQIDRKLVLWLTRKHKRLRGHRRRASHWLERVTRKETRLFAHWVLLWGQASMGRAG
ncbi:group II intron reverse transcriptase/maturase [Acidithiobacillus ferrianus]|uniref:Group II intron reverse transcriptase/maturase n=2 Tax=Acidithiobacillus ferrianus TaxID=2678518 RepID=A0ACD5H655_9PROT